MKKFWLLALIVLLSAGLMLTTTSCAKKQVKDDKTATTGPSQEELDKQKAEQDRLAREKEAKRGEVMANFEQAVIYFDYDSSVIRPESEEVLKVKAQAMKDYTDVNAIVEGHCDERGTAEYNMALGDRRANSAKKFLVDQGIEGTRLDTISYGEEKPVAKGHKENVWKQNRRAEFKVKK